MLIFVAYVILVLIFKEMLNQEEKNYKPYKGKQHPFNAFVVFGVQCLVLFVDNNHDNKKRDNK